MNTAGVKQALNDYMALARLRLVVKAVEHHTQAKAGYKSSSSRRRADSGSYVVILTAGSLKMAKQDAPGVVEKINEQIKKEVDRLFKPLVAEAISKIEKYDPLEGATQLERLFGIYTNALSIQVSASDAGGFAVIAPTGNGTARFDKQDWAAPEPSAHRFAESVNAVISEQVKSSVDSLIYDLKTQANNDH